MWYSSLDKKMLHRAGIVACFSLIVIIHTFAFVLLLHDYLKGVSLSWFDRQIQKAGGSLFIVTLPITLLLSYSVILPPLIFWLLWKDLKVKRESFSTWHLDSCGLLAQRLIFSLLCLISILSLSGCVEKSTNTKLCIRHALIPIMIPILFVCLKVLLLKSQRMVMWGGFILCALA